MELMENFGRRIRYFRELKGMNQDELSRKVGYKTKSSITKIELGQAKVPAYKVIDFANALGVEVSDLIDGLTEEPTAPTSDYFKQCVSLLIDLNTKDLEKAYTVLATMFGGETNGKRNMER